MKRLYFVILVVFAAFFGGCGGNSEDNTITTSGAADIDCPRVITNGVLQMDCRVTQNGNIARVVIDGANPIECYYNGVECAQSQYCEANYPPNAVRPNATFDYDCYNTLDITLWNREHCTFSIYSDGIFSETVAVTF